MAAALRNARSRGRGRAAAKGVGGLSPPMPFAGRKVNPPGVGMMNPPGQSNGGAPAPTGIERQPIGGQGGKAGLGGQGLPGPGGRQLEARVQSGAITSQQAQKTMQQRQTLAKALGPNWRDKLQVGGKSFAQVNAGLKKKPGNAKLAALRKRLITNRTSVITSARKGGGGSMGKPGEGAPSEGSLITVDGKGK